MLRSSSVRGASLPSWHSPPTRSTCRASATVRLPWKTHACSRSSKPRSTRRSILERVAELIESLRLVPHPEGGYYREIWRGSLGVEPIDGRGARAALTSIYFLLPAGALSRWHRVRSDELWHHHEGAPLELLLVPPDGPRLERVRLGPLGAD